VMSPHLFVVSEKRRLEGFHWGPGAVIVCVVGLVSMERALLLVLLSRTGFFRHFETDDYSQECVAVMSAATGV